MIILLYVLTIIMSNKTPKNKKNFYEIYSINIYIYTANKEVSFIFNKFIKNFNNLIRNEQNTYANSIKLQWLTRIV